MVLFYFFKSQPFRISPVPSARAGNRDCSFFVPVFVVFCFWVVFFFSISALYFYSNRETSAQVGERGAASLPRPCGEGGQSPRCGASRGPPSSPTVGSPDTGIGSCRAPALFPAASGAEQGLEPGTGHGTSLPWGGLLNPGPRFQ